MTHHRAGLARLLRDDGLDAGPIETLLDGVVAHSTTQAPLPPSATARERALLAYALKLTRDPSGITRADLEPLRAVGLDDGEILDANQVTAYFAYANRLVDGLGVQLEAWHAPPAPGRGGGPGDEEAP